MHLKFISELSRRTLGKHRTETARANARVRYEFGSFRLDPGERLLLRNGEPVALAPKAFDLLLVLVEQPGRLAEKQVLFGRVWPETAVEENNLADTISRLRKALGEDEKGQKLIETVPKHGYRFTGQVTTGEAEDGAVGQSISARPGLHWRVLALSVLLVSTALAGGLWLYARIAHRTEVERLVFQGDFYLRRWTEPELRKAIQYYDRALTLNPKESGAYAGLATAWLFLADAHEPPRVAMPKAEAAALNALRVEPTSAENHVTLGVITVQYDWDWARAEAHFKRALQLDPHHKPAHGLYGWHLMAMARLNDAVAEMRQALDADPASDVGHWGLGLPYYCARRMDESIEQYRRAIAIEPRSHWSHMLLGWALAEEGRFEEAVKEVKQALQLDDNPQVLASLGYVHAIAGQPEAARRIVSDLQQTAKRRYVSPYDVAPIYAALGENEQALGSLDQAYEDHSGWLAWWLKVDPRFEKLRAEQRFQDLLRRVGHTP